MKGQGKEVSLIAVFESVSVVEAGLMFKVDLGELEEMECPTCGSCSGMFTTNSMNCLFEALDFALPGNGTIPAVYLKELDLQKNLECTL